jgi:hypothetical protein
MIESSPPGLSRARNVALEACTTRYIVYLDDDASPRPEWLSAILRAFTTHDPAVVAGPIYPIWPHAQPEWLPRKYVGCLTILDHIENDRWLSGNEVAFGTNMAFKTEVLREVDGFNVGLGRRGAHSLLSEEEVEAQLALRQRGHRTFYAAAAGVDHAVHPDRLTRNYFRARMAWQAVSALLRDPPLQHSDWSQREIRTAADTLGVGELISKLMTGGDAQTFSAQLDFRIWTICQWRTCSPPRVTRQRWNARTGRLETQICRTSRMLPFCLPPDTSSWRDSPRMLFFMVSTDSWRTVNSWCFRNRCRTTSMRLWLTSNALSHQR